MKKILDKIKKSNKLCAIYTDIRLEKFSVQYISCTDNQYFLGVNYNPYGEFDGYTCKLVSDIILIETDNKYLSSMKKIIDNERKVSKIKLVNEDVVLSILQYAFTEKKMCSFELQNSEKFNVIGFVENINEIDEHIEVRCFDENGNANGVSYFELGDITKIVCDSLDERKIERLIL